MTGNCGEGGLVLTHPDLRDPMTLYIDLNPSVNLV